MKATSVIRHIDPLNRLQIPKVIREQLSLQAGDPMELTAQDGQIIIRSCLGNNAITKEKAV